MSEGERNEIQVKILRFNKLKDEKPTYKTYQVPFVEGMSVMNVLNHIYENIDSSLSYYCSCRIGLCGRCDMIVNGKVVQACTTLVNGDITIEPLLDLGFEPIKDLVGNDILLQDRAKLSLARMNTYQRFKRAYAKAEKET